MEAQPQECNSNLDLDELLNSQEIQKLDLLDDEPPQDPKPAVSARSAERVVSKAPVIEYDVDDLLNPEPNAETNVITNLRKKANPYANKFKKDNSLKMDEYKVIKREIDVKDEGFL